MLLRLTSPTMRSPAVVRLCELLDIDSTDSYDERVCEAVRAFQRANNLSEDGIVGPNTWRTLIDGYIAVYEDVDFVNISASHPRPRLYHCSRGIETISGVMLHQTGCQMPSAPSGWSRVNAHFGVTQEGLLIYINPITDFIWHGNGYSDITIGVEIEGNYYGVEGAESTLWKGGGPAASLRGGMLRAFDTLRKLLVSLLGSQWRYIVAHRQTSKNRRFDPGELIWKEVALRWKRLYSLNYLPVNGGYAIPHAWDSGEPVNVGC